MLIAQIHPGALLVFFGAVILGGLVVILLAGWLAVRFARPTYTWKRFWLVVTGALVAGSALAAAMAQIFFLWHYSEEVVFGAGVVGFILGAPLGGLLFAMPASRLRGLLRPRTLLQPAGAMFFVLVVAGLGYVLYDLFVPKTVDRLLVEMALPDRLFQGHQDLQRFRIRKHAREELQRRGAAALPRLIELVEQNYQYPSFPKRAALDAIARCRTGEAAAFLAKLAGQASKGRPEPLLSDHEFVLHLLSTMRPQHQQAIAALLAQIAQPATTWETSRPGQWIASPHGEAQRAAFWALLQLDPSLAEHPTLRNFIAAYEDQANGSEPVGSGYARRFLDDYRRHQSSSS